MRKTPQRRQTSRAPRKRAFARRSRRSASPSAVSAGAVLASNPPRNEACCPDLRGQLAAVVEYSNDAIFSRTLGGTFTSWNAAAARVFGFAAAEVLGQSSRMLLPPGRRDEYRWLVARIRRGRVVQHFETDRLRKDGQRIHVSLTLSPIRDGRRRLISCSTIARDITEQQRAREAIQRSERELADLFEEASVGLLWGAPEGRILRANRALLDLLECRAEECVGHNLREFHPDRADVENILGRLANRETLQNFQTSLRTRSGQGKVVLMDANGLWEKGTLIHTRWFIRDISRRKQLEREVLAISERERRAFSRELHDSLGQQLSGIAYLSNVLRDRLREHGCPEAAEAARMSKLLQQAIGETRRLSRGLSPVRPEPEGLGIALNELAAHTRDVFGIRCCFRPPEAVLVPDNDSANHLYRIAQEAVNNAAKHAHARRIGISLRQAGGKVTLAITDDGVGVGPLSPRREGLGLRIMQYRAGLSQGELSVLPKRGGGTVIKCVVPPPALKAHIPAG